MSKLLVLLALILSLALPSIVSARTTPEDIINSKKDLYTSRVKNYSPTHQQQLESLSNKIATVNKQITDDLEANVERQGEILNEYQFRHGKFDPTSNVARPDGNAIDDAHYWLTYAHEAIAYQAGHIYVFNLTSESNIKSDANSLINNLSSDISVLSNKVAKSQSLISNIISKGN